MTSSITFSKSVNDWWKSPSELKCPTPRHPTQESPKVLKARLNNRQIEFDLFRAILPDDIHIKLPTDTSIEDGETKEFYGKQIDTQLENNDSIHEFYLENNQKHEEEIHIVIIHGYMAAMGYFIKNIEPLLKSTPGIRLHLIDLPGFGNSSRQKFPDHLLSDKPDKIQEQIAQVIEAESWFIDKIEEWRLKKELSHFKILAHSMGAYLSACYLMKYNHAGVVDQIMLVSPMGTESSEVSLINDKQYQYNHHTEKSNDAFREVTDVISDDSDLWEKLGKPKFPSNFLLESLWKHHTSPFQILQSLGPLYSKLLSYWSFRRFVNLQSNEDELLGARGSSKELLLKLHNYSYSVFNQYQGSGELAIATFITHQILPKLPLCDRGFCEYILDSNVQISLVYGDKDWMNSRGGEYIHEKIQNKNKGLSEFKIIESAGHHLYLDNPEEFNEYSKAFFGL